MRPVLIVCMFIVALVGLAFFLGSPTRGRGRRFASSAPRSESYRGKAKPRIPGAPYHGNQKSFAFHHSGCQHYECPNCVIILPDRDEAIAMGFRPCGLCDP